MTENCSGILDMRNISNFNVSFELISCKIWGFKHVLKLCTFCRILMNAVTALNISMASKGVN